MATIDGRPLVVGGDIILAINGIQVRSAADLGRIRDAVNRLAPQESVKATVLRQGRTLELTGRLD